MRQDEREHELVRTQEDEAAREAAEIGGQPGEVERDPAQRPVSEAGGAEAEGFEQAERELADNAEHGMGHGSPRHPAFSPEVESNRSGAVYGDADELESTGREGSREDTEPDRRDHTPTAVDPPDDEPS